MNNNFAIITDFGFDYSVASMKALLLSSFPDAKIIDIDHSIEKFSVLSGAFVINSVFKYFPKGTIFICVIDPGVGSGREIVLLKTANYYFIGPNNGIFHHIIKFCKIEESYLIEEKKFAVISNTFHGRDIMTPAAISLASGQHGLFTPFSPEGLRLIPQLEKNENIIIYIDNFGNIKTNISSLNLSFTQAQQLQIKLNGTLLLAKFCDTFSQAKVGELICYKGSNATLEIAVNMGSARDKLRAQVGDKIEVNIK